MNITNVNKIFVVDASVIQFVVIGPKGRRDGILVKSSRVGPEILGYAMESRDEWNHTHPSDDRGSHRTPFDLLFFRSRTEDLNKVRSRPLPQLRNEDDIRDAYFTFVWSGGCGESGCQLIESVFNQWILDLQAGVVESDVERIEISLAPLLFHCIKLDEQSKSRSRFLSVYFGLMLATAAIAGLATLITSLIRR